MYGHDTEDEESQKLLKSPMDQKKIKFGTKLSSINVNKSQSKMKIKDKNNHNEAARLSEISGEELKLVTDMVSIPTNEITTGSYF